MTQEDQSQYMESTLSEIQTLLTSMKGLMILTEHYSNPKETTEYISMLYRVMVKMETLVRDARAKMDKE